MKGLTKRLTAAILLTAVCLTATVYSRTRPVELRLGFMAGSYWDAPNGNCYAVIDMAIERFEREHPNVHVTYTSGILNRDYSEWLIDQYLLGSEPDVFLVLPEDFGELCELGALVPLDGYLAQDEAVSDTDFYPAALQSGAENGVQYALPYECVPTLMCVNKTLLESEGIAVPSGDWTWEDFYNICAKVTHDTDSDGEIDQFGCYGYTWQDALTANGASLFTEDGRSCLISEPKAVQAVAFAQRLNKLTAETAPSARDFDEGKVAFRPFLFSDYRTYQPYPWRIKRYSDFLWDCIPMPHGPAGGNSSELSTVLAGISSRSAHTTLAWQFLRELTANADNQSMLFTDSHSVSALRSVTDSDETRRILRQDTPGESQSGVEMLSDVMEQAVAAPRFRNYDQALLFTEGLVQNAMEDEHNLSLQLQRVQHQVQEYLQE